MLQSLANAEFDRAELTPASPNHVLASLPQAHRERLVPHLACREMRIGELIAESGHMYGGVYFPLAGLISVVTPLRDGRTVESAILGREGCLGYIECAGSGIAFSRSVVQHDLRAAFLPVAEFRRLRASAPEIMERLHLAAECLTAHSQQSVACQAQHGMRPRLCRWMATAQDRSGEQVLHFTQQFLAEMLGVQRTTVTDVASDIQARGWIQYARGKIRILDGEALRQNACECYADIRRHEARVWASTEPR